MSIDYEEEGFKFARRRFEDGRKQGALEEIEKVKVMFNRLTIEKFLDWLYEEKKELEKKGRCLKNG
jgi:hypothetical protein